MTTPTQQWSGWLPWTGGECPIPWAKANGWARRLRSGYEVVASTAADINDWSHDGVGSDIVAYRHIIRPTEAPAEPSPSLVEAAEAMAAAAESVSKLLADAVPILETAIDTWNEHHGAGTDDDEPDEIITDLLADVRRIAGEVSASLFLFRSTTSKEG